MTTQNPTSIPLEHRAGSPPGWVAQKHVDIAYIYCVIQILRTGASAQAGSSLSQSPKPPPVSTCGTTSASSCRA